MKDTIIFDLDNTLCDIRHRLHYLKNDTPDWDEPNWEAFHQACVDDLPKPDIIALARALNIAGYAIYILTGRSSIVQKETIEWLAQNEVPCHALIMRAEGDHRPDTQLKLEIVQNLKLTPEEVVCIFDDRPLIVDMWHKNGYTCCQVAQWSKHE